MSTLGERFSELKELRKSMPNLASVIYKDTQAKTWYETERNKVKKRVYVYEVKREHVVLKRDPNAKDSFTETRAKFDKLYKQIPAPKSE